ncbi:pentatricopeptide repeat-containing protein [Panicum miliaceum]|uniref:Pentatricopeptide repeat-containing protein n=1 Tax=Panicum miliaceum TaxID=4540 RepID=A0A3L6TEK6_PANMI|nr:pentatricopeptide repeat-containing protein [Panicum miliaceum]
MEKDGGVEPDAIAYATIVGGLCKARMVEATKLFKEMRSKCLLVDRTAYASLIDVYVSTKMVGDGCRVLKVMIDAGYRVDL